MVLTSENSSESHVALFTGGFDRSYVHGLATALAGKGVRLDVIGSTEVECAEMHSFEAINFLNYQPDSPRDDNLPRKILRLISLYIKLIRYAARAKPRLFHILWNYRLVYLDRTLLMLYYRLLRKRVFITAHNVNEAKRDGRDSWMNRLTLRVQYHLASAIFVHTSNMKNELISDFGIHPSAIHLIPFGVNEAVPDTTLSSIAAKKIIGINQPVCTLLFFGRIRPSKGLETLVGAMEILAHRGVTKVFLIIAGEPKKEHVEYWQNTKRRIEYGPAAKLVSQHIECIPDDQVEVYFKAADALVLPYNEIYQSGVLFLGYRFGLPVIATDVGSFREEVVSGETGFVCRRADAADLAATIETFLSSSLYAELESRKVAIKRHASVKYSWQVVADLTISAYSSVRESLVFGNTRFDRDTPCVQDSQPSVASRRERTN